MSSPWIREEVEKYYPDNLARNYYNAAILFHQGLIDNCKYTDDFMVGKNKAYHEKIINECKELLKGLNDEDNQ